jgi:hypothetical protein
MKKLYFIILVSIFSFTEIKAQTYSGGDGTAQSPYQISTKSDLNTLCITKNHWNLHFELVNNIAIQSIDYQSGGAFFNSGDGFQTIGDVIDDGMMGEWNGFTGSFNGNGNKISGVVINMSAKSMFKGFFGSVSNATISNLVLENISVTETATERTGGLAGEASNSTITNCSVVSGTISSTAAAGSLIGSSYKNTISNCSSGASVNCSNIYCGGLVGYTGDGSISNSYSTGSVNGAGSIGGLVGYTYANPGFSQNITNCYAVGQVSNVNSSGGLVGEVACCFGPTNVVGSFWDIQTTGQPTSAGGTGLETPDMKNQITYNNANWDFNGVWLMGTENNGYPYLSWQTFDNNTPEPTPLTKVSNPTCGGTVQSTNDLIYCDAVAGATNYQWRWVGGGIDETVSRQAIYNDFKAKMVPGIQNNTTYTVSVRALTSQGWGEFGESCSVEIIGVSNTQLIGCDQSMTNAENLLRCTAVSGAQDYEWLWVYNMNPLEQYERKRNAVYNDFKPSTMFPGMRTGAFYTVYVRAKVNNIWGEYSAGCVVLTPSVADTRVQNTWCNRTLSQVFMTIKCNAVSGATDYEWEWSNNQMEISQTRRRGNVNNDFSTKWITDLGAGQTWHVRVRAKANGVWGNYSTVCTISTPGQALRLAENKPSKFDDVELEEEIVMYEELSENETDYALVDSDLYSMVLYPNPSNGEQVRIAFGGITKESKAVVNIYDVYGKQVYRKQLNKVVNGDILTVNTYNELPAGIYFVITQIDNQQLQEKLIIK